MLEHEYFDHYRAAAAPSLSIGSCASATPTDADGYTIGENIAWASASIATPRKMVSAVDALSPAPQEHPHEAHIATRRSRRCGRTAASAARTPDSGGPFVIYVNQFGARY